MAANGILMVQQATSAGAPLTKRVQIQAARMRLEVAGPSGVTQVVIFDSGKQVLYMLDPARQTYIEMTRADVDRLNAVVKESLAQIRAHPEMLPAEQRTQMEAMTNGRDGAAAALEYTRTGTDHVGRWTCDKYDLMRNGQKIGDVCTVDPSTLGFAATDLDVLRQMSEFFSAMAPHIASPLPDVSPVGPLGHPGFAVKTVMMVDGLATTLEVVEVERQTFSDALFAVPAGFKKQDVTGGMSGRGFGHS